MFIRNRERIRGRNKRRNHANQVFLSSILIFAIVMFCFAITRTGVTASSTCESYQTITVSRGDTLWGIAKSLPGSNKVDIRRIVFQIKKINGLTNSTLTPGQYLMVPDLDI
jgi:cell division protein YceG involved in septum cleavage